MGCHKKTTQELTTELHCLELPTITVSCGVKKFESIFPLRYIFIYIIEFFINLQITTEWAFAFLNTAIIMFCLRYSLNIPHHSLLCKTQHPSFQNSDFSNISLHRHRKIILEFFSCDFTIFTADVFTYYSFFYRFQTLKLNLVEHFRFTNCYGKANKKRISWHSGTWLHTHCLLVNQ